MPLEISEALLNSLRQFEPYFAAQAALVGPELNASLAKVSLAYSLCFVSFLEGYFLGILALVVRFVIGRWQSGSGLRFKYRRRQR
jgi:hypothetical protein